MRLDAIPCADGLSRRDFLRLGGAVFGGISLPRILEASQGKSDVSCLIFFQNGGACQHDSFDPKPDAPREIRGGFGTIPTAIPGVHFSELLPRSAKAADKFTVIRSLYSKEAIHEKAKQFIYSGARPNNAFKHPVYGSVVAKEFGSKNGLPPFVVIPRKGYRGRSRFSRPGLRSFHHGRPGEEEFLGPRFERAHRAEP